MYDSDEHRRVYNTLQVGHVDICWSCLRATAKEGYHATGLPTRSGKVHLFKNYLRQKFMCGLPIVPHEVEGRHSK